MNRIVQFIAVAIFESSKVTDKANTITYIFNESTHTSTSIWEKNMPWIVALIVGLMTVIANLLISYQSRKTNRKILSEQLAHNKEIALEQIKNSQINAQKDFNKTVLSGNRQMFINQVREIIGSILTKVSIIFLKEQLETKDYDELKLLITKAELFLTPGEDEALLGSLKSLDIHCFEILSQGKDISLLSEKIETLKIETLKKIQTEWDKVTKGI